MRMAATDRKWRVEDLAALPDDGNRYEIIAGELLVTPAPTWRHGEAVQALLLILQPWLSTNALGHAKIAPADVVYGVDTVVEPDLFVVPLVDGRRPRSWEEAGRLLLAVEVISPSTARRDRVAKRWLYQRQEVPEYWIVDVDAALVERWRPGDERPEILSDRIDWQPSPGAAVLTIDLVAYFREVVGTDTRS